MEKLEHPLRWWHLPLLLLLIVGTVYAAREYRSQGKDGGKRWSVSATQTHEGFVFGTVYHVKYESTKDLQAVIDAALASVDHSLSMFDSLSNVSLINQNQTDTLDAQVQEVLTLSQGIWQATGGAFDVTVAPLVNAWGFGFKQGLTVDSASVDSLRQFIGMEKLTMVGNTVKKNDPRMMLDFSAVAKGYGVDAVGKALEQAGVKNYMVEIGGEVRVKGYGSEGGLWRIGVDVPEVDSLGGTPELADVLEVTDMSMATSGNYRNYREVDGKRVGHTIDPRTGYPAESDVLSATVLAEDCATADAWATALMVLGVNDGRKALAGHPELKVLLLCADSAVKINYE